MKATVIRAFTDKQTGEVRLPGLAVELSDDRAKELSVLGYVEIIKVPAKPRAKRTSRE